MNRLKELREQKGDTKIDVGNAIGVSSMTIGRWENQEELNLKSDKAQALADYFGVWLPYLLGNSNIRTEEQANFLAEMNKRINSEGDSFSFDMTVTESDEHDLLYNYRQLETPYKNQVRKFTRDMWELQKESKNLPPKFPDTQ
ncbi:TPA: helix-turn-helix transcriptional regulator [Streptococcus pyogenes]|nr:helix-turn-helix transcriptional regulator [Streptococcus pyogenes]